jgi:hypothetical protein
MAKLVVIGAVKTCCITLGIFATPDTESTTSLLGIVLSGHKPRSEWRMWPCIGPSIWVPYEQFKPCKIGIHHMNRIELSLQVEYIGSISEGRPEVGVRGAPIKGVGKMADNVSGAGINKHNRMLHSA